MTQALAAKTRAQLLNELFLGGVPFLWCPLLTHYDSEGRIDGARMARHVEHLAPHVRGFLVPGSTSDGWDLTEAEEQKVLGIALEQAAKFRAHLLVGILRAEAGQARTRLRAVVQELMDRTRSQSSREALARARVCGFTICPPKGAATSQAEMRDQLAGFLAEGLPTALYQLPQVTQNEIGPELAADLAKEFINFVLFKDTSGTDQIALSGKSLDGVFMVRGAEGEYARWFRSGVYPGFLLSTANCFARELSQMIEALSAGRTQEGNELSARLTTVIADVFRLVSPLQQGNLFTNANKAMDHFFAYGPRAAALPGPRLHAGIRLPDEMIRATAEILARNGFMPAKGYLE
jgi:dihydrodipicolinate synthase/N-acetylneuraminate lyase